MNTKKFETWTRYLQWATGLAFLAILGSCVSEIDSIGGGHDSNRKMAGVFFFHLFLIIPCLFALYVFLQIRLEKLCLSETEIQKRNDAHIQGLTDNAGNRLGSLSSMAAALLKKNKK